MGRDCERHGDLTRPVGRYALEGHSYGFGLGSYDRSQPLVIDPSLAYSTYLGGSGQDRGAGVAVDAAGSAYVTGWTFSADFPTTAGAFDTTFGGASGFDAFVTKVNPAGSALVYSTYLGGTSGDQGRGIAVDTAGNAYVTGETSSSNFPTTAGAFDTTFGGASDAFVTKISPTGSSLLYSTYLGGFFLDNGVGVAVDALGSAYVTGEAGPTFPTTPLAFDTTLGGISDAFVTKLSPTGSSLLYSTYLGGPARTTSAPTAVESPSTPRAAPT